MNSDVMTTIVHAIPTDLSPYLFVTAMVIVAVLALFAIATNIKHIWLAVVIPALLMVVILSYATIHSFMTMPTDIIPQEEVQLIGFSTDGTWMYYWVNISDKEYPITIRLPYSKEKHQEAAKGMESVDAGVTMVGNIGDDKMPSASVWYEYNPLSNILNPLKDP